MTQRLSGDLRDPSPPGENGARGSFADGPAFAVGCVLVLWVVVAIAALSPVVAIGAVALGGMAVYLLLLSLGNGAAPADGPGPLERAATPVIIAAMFFAPMNDVRPTSAASFVTVTDALLGVGFCLLAPVLLRRKLTLPKTFVFGWALLFSSGLVASLLATNSSASFNHLARLIAAALLMPVAFAWWRPERRIIVRLAAAFVLGVAVSVVAAVIEGPVGEESRHDGLTTHSNFLGHTSVIAVALLLFVLTQHPPHRRWIWYGIGLACGYGVWISGSRASFVALIIIAVVYPFFERSLFAAGGALFGIALTLVFWNQIVSGSGDSALRRLLGTSASQTSDGYRREHLEEALNQFLAHPLTGNGFENALSAHNVYLQIAAAAGVIGLAGFVFILAALALPLFSAPRPYHRLAYPALAYLVIGALDKSLWDRFIWVGLVLALLAHFVADRPERIPNGSPVRYPARR